MKIRQIIENKAIKETHKIGAQNDVSEAANMLSQLKIGALLVSDDGQKIDGIVTERDIVRELGQSGSSCLQKKVSEIMTTEVKTIDADLDARSAMQMMSDGRFRHLPVIDEGKMIGVLSIGDVVSTRLKEMENENNALNDMISGSVF